MNHRPTPKPRNILTLLALFLLLAALVLSLSGCGRLVRIAIDVKDSGFLSPAPRFVSHRLEDAQNLNPDDIKVITLVRVTEGGMQELVLADRDAAHRYMALINDLKLTSPSKTATTDDSLSIKIKTKYFYKEIELSFEGDNYLSGKDRMTCEGLDALKKQVDTDMKN